MATRALTQTLGNMTTYRYGVDSYDSTKLGIGKNIFQYNGGSEGNFAGPAPIGVARPNEQTTPIPSVYPWAMQWQNNTAGELDWVFFADNAAAAATRRINAFTYNRRTSLFVWKGFTTVTFPTATNFTIRGFRMTYDLETTGTVAVSGTTVTGTSTLFSTNKVCVGNRIGFGSTDPTLITSWYEISAINSDTSITLVASAGTISAGTSYVIEDLRCVMATTNATTTNGGLMVCKGLSFDNFSSIGGTVPAATTVDNIRACYWLADASTVTNTVSLGLGISTRTSPTSHFVYVLDTVANPVVFKYNIRAALTLTAGKDTTSLVFKTGSGGIVTGVPSQANNGRLATLSHGPLSGVEALYFTTTTRVYACATSTILSGSTTWLSGGYVMQEVPPGGVNTIAASSLMNSLEYASNIDKFIILVNATTTAFRSYVTQFRTDVGAMDRIFGVDNRQIDQSTADSTITPLPTLTGGAYSVWSEGGIAYISTIGITAQTNRIYAVPLASDWEYAASSKSVLIFPASTVTDVSKFTGVYGSAVQVIGGKTGYNLGTGAEPFRLSYRTSGISDDSGSWNIVDGTGIISGGPSSQIQIKAEFRTIGLSCVPARLCSITTTYEDLSTDTHYQFSVTKSDVSNKRFAYRFSTAFGSTVPALRIRLYDAVTASLLVDDNTTSPTGTFERSTDGTTFSAWNNTDKGNETTYLRYTPSSLADSINVRPLLTLL